MLFLLFSSREGLDCHCLGLTPHYEKGECFLPICLHISDYPASELTVPLPLPLPSPTFWLLLVFWVLVG